MNEKMFYAVIENEDPDWGFGSYDYNEAVEMAKKYDGAYIAAIDESGREPMCVEEIREF